MQEDEIVKQRMEKLAQIRQKGIEPYGDRFLRSSTIREVTDGFVENKQVSLAGRVTALRAHGRAIFADLKDSSGKIQIYLKEEIIGEEEFCLFEKVDIGDILGLKGSTFKTKTGEPTLKVLEFTILAKGLRPLPEKWHGLKDVETRYRQRYLDLIANEQVKETFILRTKIIEAIRSFLNSQGYLEVETPMMHPVAGGAAGRPFKTYHNELDLQLYLRIAPELYLKRLLVGGFERVYEINRSFRNEGISTRHSPEFTMLELYCAYSDYEGMMRLTEGIILHVAREVLGRVKFDYQDKQVDLSLPWRQESFARVVKERFDITPQDSAREMADKLKKRNVSFELSDAKPISRSQVVKVVEELLQEESLSCPVFFTDYFSYLCPLAKRRKDAPFLSERFELFVGGLEVANAYSELNDPIEQRKRFEEETKERQDPESRMIDEDFLLSLEYGMPPAGGLGIGLDRLTMLFANRATIREVILFPQLKPARK